MVPSGVNQRAVERHEVVARDSLHRGGRAARAAAVGVMRIQAGPSRTSTATAAGIVLVLQDRRQQLGAPRLDFVLDRSAAGE